MTDSQHSAAEILIRNVSRHMIAASVRGLSVNCGEEVMITLSDSQTAKGRVIAAREGYFVVELEAELEIAALADLAQHRQEFLRDEGNFELYERHNLTSERIDPTKAHLV